MDRRPRHVLGVHDPAARSDHQGSSVEPGLAQAIGQASLEGCRYDPESGQLLTGSFMDYAMPRATDVPAIEFHSFETLCTTNPVGAKGCGEASAIAGPAATINAICNALSDYGVTHVDMPATPEAVWQAIREANASSAEGEAT